MHNLRRKINRRV